MLRSVYLFLILASFTNVLHAQYSQRIIILHPQTPSAYAVKGGTLYFLDSVRVSYHSDIKSLDTADVADIHILTNKDSIRMLRLGMYDTVMYIHTKAWKQRSDVQKSIPTSRQLSLFASTYYYRGDRYTGKVVDYYTDGRVKYKGAYEDGKRIGTHYYYDEDGAVFRQVFNTRGFKEEECWYTQDDKLYKKLVRRKGVLLSIEGYYSNGQLQHSTTIIPEKRSLTLEYFSNGKLRDSVAIDVIGTSNRKRMRRSTKIAGIKTMMEVHDYDVALKTDPENPDIYSSRALWYADSLQFDAALQDLDVAITKEPFDPVFFGMRALVRIRKYAWLAEHKTVDHIKMLDFLRTKPRLNIPADEMKKIKYDLYKGYTLTGDKQANYFEVYQSLTKNTP